MPDWTRPTTLRPDLCRWRQAAGEWEFGPVGCEIVYTLDDSIVDDPRARDASWRPVEAHAAELIHDDGRVDKQFLGMKTHDTGEWLSHPEARMTLPSRRWFRTVYTSTFCEHHSGHAEPHRMIHDETWLLHDAADLIVARVPLDGVAIEIRARWDADRNLHFIALPLVSAGRRELERHVAEALGHERVRVA